MEKAVLISIRPKWCDLIASGQKTIEVRKTKPNAGLPLKCYIYCTKPSYPHEDFFFTDDGGKEIRGFHGGGKVIGEFICHNIFPISFYASDASYFDTEPPFPVPGTCLTDKEIAHYLGNGKTGYGWLISELIIYDKPKELYDFYKPICKRVSDCGTCRLFDRENFVCRRNLVLTRPPQSWCYVEAWR